jgi:hypothetical protein
LLAVLARLTEKTRKNKKIKRKKLGLVRYYETYQTQLFLSLFGAFRYGMSTLRLQLADEL